MSDAASSSSQGASLYLTVQDDKVANGTGLSMRKLDANMTDQQTFVADHHRGLHPVAAPDYLLSRKGNFYGAQGCCDGDGLHLWEDKRGGPNGGNQRWLVQEEHLVLEGTQLAASINPDVAGGVCLRQSKKALRVRLRDYDYDESIPRVALTRTQQIGKDGQDSADGDGSLTGRQIGNSLDDSAPAEDSPLGSEKSCTVKSQAAQEMLEMQGNQSPQGAPRAAAESFSEVNGEASQSLTARQAAQEMLEMQGNQSPRGAPRAAAESFSEVNGEGSKVTPKTLHFYIGDGTDVSDVPFDVSTFFLFGNLFGHRSKGHSFAVLRATALAPAEFEALVDALEILKKARIETTFNPQRASVTSIMALVAKTAGDRCSLQCLRFGGDHGHHTFAKNVPEGRGFLVNARRGASLRCCACANCPGPRQTCDGCGKNFHFHPENFYIAEKSIEFALCETCSTGSPEP